MGPATATATSRAKSRAGLEARPRLGLIFGIVVGAAWALACVGCGSSAKPKRLPVSTAVSTVPTASTRSTPSTRIASSAGLPAAFAWLAAPAPATWKTIPIPSGGSLVYPPGWHPARGDRGTATAVEADRAGNLLGYLNLTPRQANEQLGTWASFRLAHNREEGDIHIRRLAAGTGLTFRSGHGSCVKDIYSTRFGTRYVEIACLVTGSRTSAVVVGAAPPGVWPRIAGAIEQAIAAVRA